MQTVKVDGDFDMDLATCYERMSEPGLYDHLAARQGMTNRQFKGLVDEGPIRRWEVELTRHDQIPAFVRPFVDLNSVRWVQKFTMDTRTMEFRIEVDMPVPARVLSARGRGRLIGPEPGRSRLELELEIESQLPVVGRQLEAFIASRARTLLAQDIEIRREYFERPRPAGS